MTDRPLSPESASIKKFFPNTIFQVAGLFLSAIVASVPVLFIFETYLKHIDQEITFSVLFAMVYLVAIGLVYWINKKRGHSLPLNFKIESASLLLLALINFAALRIAIISPLVKILNGHNNIGNNPFPSGLYCFGAVILAPLLEEIIFRGILMRGFLERYSSVVAILLSSVIFALAHGQPVKILGSLIVGLFIGWIYWKTRSLGFAILLHFSHNFIVLIEKHLRGAYILQGRTYLDLYGHNTPLIMLIVWAVFLVSGYYLVKEVHQKC